MKTLTLTFALCLALAGCNTMAGLGEDMQQAGSKLQQKASGSQQTMASGYSDQVYDPMSPPNFTPPPPPQPYPGQE
jgi:predicted small secreted protein